MSLRMSSVLWYALFVMAAALFPATAAEEPKPEPTAVVTLPLRHECQKQLRAYMSTLTEQDFTHGVTGQIDAKAPADTDPDYLYRNYLYTHMRQPLVGSKDSVPAIQAPPANYLLSNIETPAGVCNPPVWPETLMSFVQWDYAGNPYRDNRALKLRAFVGAVVQMIMFMDFAESNPSPVRADWYGYNPVIWAAPYPGFKDVLPPAVQRAYETCLKIAGERIMSWPVRNETCETDLLGPLGLVYISRAINDTEFTRKVEAYTRPVFTEERYFHPAGYWNERGGIELGFGGTANFYATWIALMTDWPFAKEALERSYRLRTHLLLPEPDGKSTGPTHFNSRLDTPHEQWAYARAGAAMLTDEAASLIRTPSPEQLAGAPAERAKQFIAQFRITVKKNPDFYSQEELDHIKNTRWTPRIWMTYRFPVSVNPSYEFYRKSAFAHRQELEKADSPLLKSPFLRGENFIRAFEKDFVVARQPGFAAILHTGPVGVQTPDDKKIQYPGPLGLGGGQLSAFWTPGTGPVILGLRGGMTMHQSYDTPYSWETWPIHAVSGSTADGKVFTSARIARPEVVYDVKDDSATVTVSGPLVAMKVGKDPSAADPEKAGSAMYDEQFMSNARYMPGWYQGAEYGVPVASEVNYTRTMKITDKGVRVETTVSGKGSIPAIFETIPVYLGAGQEQKAAANVKIEYLSRDKWVMLTERNTGVKVIRITRFGHAVTVTFDKPVMASIAPAEWTGRYLNKYAACRNIRIALETGIEYSFGSTMDFTYNGERKIFYEIAPVAEEPAQ